QLAGQASKLGLNISPGDTLNVDITLLGSIGAPQFKFNLLGNKDGAAASIQDAVKGRLNAEVEDQKNEAEAEVNDRANIVKEGAQRRIDSLRSLAGARTQQVLDSITRATQTETDRLKDQTAEELRNRLKLDSLRADSLLNKVPGADAIKEELERLNPFKKKKPGGGK
ncbi:MAG: LPS O-antigen subunit length determinant protein (WzzB/FepE family), partial [Bdellovibrionota bacterium]